LSKIKEKLLVIALVGIILTLCTQSTLAYYTVIGHATNVVTSGGITLEIHEMTDQGTAFPEEGVYVLPGDVVSKIVTVENVCAHPFYLRVKLIYGSNREALSPEDCFRLNINTEHWLYSDGWYYYTGILQPGEQTPYVFSQVEIVGSQVDTSDIGSALSITVLAQAVQSQNNSIPGEDTTSVQGWPAE